MNEITLTGNVARIDKPRRTRSGETVVSFDLAVDNGYKDNNDRWISRTLFQPVVTYRGLADHVAATFAADPSGKAGKGMTLTVTGRLLDDSYTRSGSDIPVKRTKLDATDVAASLRYATAVVTKVAKTHAEEGMEHNREQLAATA